MQAAERGLVKAIRGITWTRDVVRDWIRGDLEQDISYDQRLTSDNTNPEDRTNFSETDKDAQIEDSPDKTVDQFIRD